MKFKSFLLIIVVGLFYLTNPPSGLATPLLIKIKPTPHFLKKIQDLQGEALLQHAQFINDELIRVDTSTPAGQKALENLKKNFNVEYIEPDHPIYAHELPNDPELSRQSMYMQSVSALPAWELLVNPAPVIVAIIDSGIDPLHEDLQANVWVNTLETPNNGIDDEGDGFADDVLGYNFSSNDPNINDDNGHGTLIAGIMGAVGNNDIGIAGLNWNCQLLVIKILDENGISSISKAISAIQYARQHGAKVINASWGFASDATTAETAQSLQQAIELAQSDGILFVASVGNGISFQGQNNDDLNATNYPSSFNLDNIVSVAALDNKDDLAFFSNYGNNSVDLAAPGVDIFSTSPGNNYSAMSGTSISAPFVTGAASLLLAINPGLTPLEVKALLLQNVDVLSALKGKVFTSGKLNIANALTASPAISGEAVNTDLQASFIPGELPTNPIGGGGCNLTPHSPSTLSLFLILPLLLALGIRVTRT
ncbi:MAG: S8 family serine peptidase [Deltaproteobacteria bacterium]|nr:S8 family serine peptidase [Deltaproteobacteria bacterium]